MTDCREDERERPDREKKRRREERERRSDDLKEAWRRQHPSEPDEGEKGGPRKGRPT